MKNPKKNIIWLASYPKSGNTWFRILLSNILSDTPEPVNINSLIDSPIASNRGIFDNYTGVNSSDLTNEEINNYRPDVYRLLSAENETDLFIKVHDAWQLNTNNQPIFPYDVTKKAIYIIRNPYDVAVSYSEYFSISIAEAIENLRNSDHSLCDSNRKLSNQLQQNLFSWSKHVTSWIDESRIPIFIIRYEDLLNDTISTFRTALEFLDIKFTENKLLDAVNKSDFESVSLQEKEQGFTEKSSFSSVFFRRGKSSLKSELVKNPDYSLLMESHGVVMKRYGY